MLNSNAYICVCVREVTCAYVCMHIAMYYDAYVKTGSLLYSIYCKR